MVNLFCSPMQCFEAGLIEPGDLRHTAPSFIHAAAILTVSPDNNGDAGPLPRILQRLNIFSRLGSIAAFR